MVSPAGQLLYSSKMQHCDPILSTLLHLYFLPHHRMLLHYKSLYVQQRLMEHHVKAQQKAAKKLNEYKSITVMNN